MELSKKVSYLKGLMDGLKIDESTNEGKILTALKTKFTAATVTMTAMTTIVTAAAVTTMMILTMKSFMSVYVLTAATRSCSVRTSLQRVLLTALTAAKILNLIFQNLTRKILRNDPFKALACIFCSA